MEAFKIIMTLLVSALIGYFTNFIAVKMLFRPRTEKHIFGRRLPFTPGVIPKNKPRLAKALGNAVGRQLLTGDDLKNALSSDKVVGAAADKITDSVFSDKPIGDIAETLTGSGEAVKAAVSEKLTAVITEKIKQADISGIIVREGVAAVKQKVSGSMLAMFVTDDMISSFAAPLALKIDAYLDENAEPTVSAAVNDELDKLFAASPAQLLEGSEITRERVREAASGLIRKAAADSLDEIIASVDVPGIVEARVNAMSVEEVEELVMSVMKHELNAVISLGGLIGLVIGVLNVIIQRI